jgi:predicted lipoprotein with Yx(FWY)xxD motif
VNAVSGSGRSGWAVQAWAVVRRLLATLVLILVLPVAACGSDSGEPEAEQAAMEQTAAERAPEPPAEPEPAAPPGVEISTADSQFGAALFDGDDQAIYYFEPERDSKPKCYGTCAEAWPPVLTDGEPEATGAARQRLLGTTARRDGSVQVTYDDRPLYYYANEGPGELRCHNIFHEGGLWLAVQPDGAAVPHDPAATIDIG